MTENNSIPGYAEIADWPIDPSHPVRIESCGRYRDGGPQGGTFYVDLMDANEIRISFFFDRFLGRLCYGSSTEGGDDAAFLRKGSSIQREAFELISRLADESSDYSELRQVLEFARTWT